MMYSDVIKNGWILSKKSKYTVKDVKNLMKKGFSVKESRFIAICSAIFYDTDFSKTISDYEKLALHLFIS